MTHDVTLEKQLQTLLFQCEGGYYLMKKGLMGRRDLLERLIERGKVIQNLRGFGAIASETVVRLIQGEPQKIRDHAEAQSTLKFLKSHDIELPRAFCSLIPEPSLSLLSDRLPRQKSSQFKIDAHYFHRDECQFFDDTECSDDWQKEVYTFARQLYDSHTLKTVIDIGCGSAGKLIQYFGDVDFIGTELPPTVAWLKEKCPDRTWIESDFGSGKELTGDLVICADVIEHLGDPGKLLSYIKDINPKYLVLSTPDRDTIARNGIAYPCSQWGPPTNPHHVREWSFKELASYIGKYFKIVDHKITSQKQGTQMIICKIS